VPSPTASQQQFRLWDGATAEEGEAATESQFKSRIVQPGQKWEVISMVKERPIYSMEYFGYD